MPPRQFYKGRKLAKTKTLFQILW